MFDSPYPALRSWIDSDQAFLSSWIQMNTLAFQKICECMWTLTFCPYRELFFIIQKMIKHQCKTVYFKNKKQVQSTVRAAHLFFSIKTSASIYHSESKLGEPPRESKTAQLKQHRQTFPWCFIFFFPFFLFFPLQLISKQIWNIVQRCLHQALYELMVDL